MNSKQITYLTDVSLITCVVAAGRADAVIKAAHEMGAAGALAFHARGVGARERLGLLGIAIEAEKDVVNVLVPKDYEDVVFESVYRAADLGQPGAGFAYITPLDKMATYVPKEILQHAKELSL